MTGRKQTSRPVEEGQNSAEPEKCPFGGHDSPCGRPTRRRRRRSPPSALRPGAVVLLVEREQPGLGRHEALAYATLLAYSPAGALSGGPARRARPRPPSRD